jgi:hypothetical protein
MGCVTIMCSTPSRFPSLTSIRSSSGDEWPVARTSLFFAITVRTSRTSGRNRPLRETLRKRFHIKRTGSTRTHIERVISVEDNPYPTQPAPWGLGGSKEPYSGTGTSDKILA